MFQTEEDEQFRFLTNEFVIEEDQQQENNQETEKLLKSQNQNQPVETKIGSVLTDITTKRVIILIFSIIVSIPLFSTETYSEQNITSLKTGLDFLQLMREQQNVQIINWTIQNYINDHINRQDIRYEVIFLKINEIIYKDSLQLQKLRESEQIIYETNLENNQLESYNLIYSVRKDAELNAILSISRTLVLILILVVSSIFFNKDSNEIVVDPIVRMLVKIKMISENPLEAARISEDEAVAEEEYKKTLNKKELEILLRKKQYETTILETTIIKIGGLLALGFGEAGSQIIAQNMSNDGNINPMIPGKKIMAIFGFVSIRNFIDVTNILQESVMLFTNQIAEIIHIACDSYHGIVNKNLGDCFLIIWKFAEKDKILSLVDDQIFVEKLQNCSNFTDLSVVAFLKTQANVYKLSQTKLFKQHLESIKQYIPDFKLKLGFGLHVGWGIEGSIGSQFKIDASYLSPNVNLASRLECATKQYGVSLLLSGAVYRLLSNKTQKYLRHIDRVTVKGSQQPMDLYTCDMNSNMIQIEKVKDNIIVEINKYENKKVLRFIQRKKKDIRYYKIIKNQIVINKLFDIDNDLIIMRQNYNQVKFKICIQRKKKILIKEFFSVFHQGLVSYLEGYWKDAQIKFQIAQELFFRNINNQQQKCVDYLQIEENIQLDGPIQTLITYMSKFQFESPYDWKGYRELVDK
ncbi:hypothetical protein IMG5_120200 [Ichthyophthirius multifiliis]|uniref:Guanylate cyclase domain-containing protein n=1 Tax=Ichthyophthirius multifiliis TaxID=5932 RepID=G0QUZ7_ICHMU|nr:hypothetical protein IMG5_120200 [Ichthyophthirius multifiliis]EGR30957.1 hypothetical protein IMG5_120200 [Ichthyophthirius multifiliis]|eukprot:XP_004032544.1 hypothetical protein IMG5_120200 [Ichthyophthirius multifiliis]